MRIGRIILLENNKTIRYKIKENDKIIPFLKGTALKADFSMIVYETG